MFGNENQKAALEDRQLLNRARADRVLRWFRSCAICKSFVPPIDLLCKDCWELLCDEMNDGETALQPGYPFPVYSLLTWTPKNDHLIRPFIYAFKGGRAAGPAGFLIEQLTYRCDEVGLESPVFVYPGPTKKNQLDHSWLIAQKMARYWETTAFQLTKDPTQMESQKKRSARDRSMRRFQPVVLGDAERVGFSNEEINWVFVDDVITTGSTAMAAYMALGDPKDFEVWTLVSRPKLADSKGL
jgi:predicted amidophosphoribosyltransferase